MAFPPPGWKRGRVHSGGVGSIARTWNEEGSAASERINLLRAVGGEGIKSAITIMLTGIHWHELDAVRDDEAVGIFIGNGDSGPAPSGQSEFAEGKEAFVAGVALVYFDRPGRPILCGDGDGDLRGTIGIGRGDQDDL